MERKVIVIAGPTCSGKTSCALALAKLIPIEVISADSRQIYKTLSIGTAKPTSAECSAVPHHLVDFLELTEEYNASRFSSDAARLIDEIFSRGNTPVVVGGAGLYIRALTNGIIDAACDDLFRERLMALRNSEGNKTLYRMLCDIDPVSAETMTENNWKRVIRALEVFHTTGKMLSQWLAAHNSHSTHTFLMFGLDLRRDVLYSAINDRVDDMMENGLFNEVQFLSDAGFSPELNALNTVGYKELFQVLNGSADLESAVCLIKRNTRRYAKRQMTWFRNEKRISWYLYLDKSEIPSIAQSIALSFLGTKE